MSQADGDFRIRIGFFRNLKTRRLRSELGAEGVLALVTLWAYTAENHATGKLGKADASEIEAMAEWAGERGAFYAALTSMRLIDVSKAGIVGIHDWSEHQQWIVNRPVRQRASRIANKRRWDRELQRLRDGSEAESGPDPRRTPDLEESDSDSADSGLLPSSPSPSLPSLSEEDPPTPLRGDEPTPRPKRGKAEPTPQERAALDLADPTCQR
ncbi:MAG: hypothetical protein KDB73_15860, partial [Planctomycetes bacterium]|nr:hypothetical protein [Planctomycetota bacterium]